MAWFVALQITIVATIEVETVVVDEVVVVGVVETFVAAECVVAAAVEVAAAGGVAGFGVEFALLADGCGHPRLERWTSPTRDPESWGKEMERRD